MNEHQKNENADPFAERRKLTFAQAEGVEPLPSQLQLKEMSPALRAALWDVLFRSINVYRMGDWIGDGWGDILRTRHVYRLHRPVDEFTTQYQHVIGPLKTLVMDGDYVQVLGFFQDVFRHSRCPRPLPGEIEVALKFGCAAYRVFDKTIVPIGSEAELSTVQRAFADLGAAEFHGARAHLRKGAEELTAGKASDSIRESIHAVESVVRVLEPGGDFAKALAKLESKIAIHGALKKGFASIYGFTSDEKGIRHPLLDEGAAKVDETDALFMIGACAAFVSYLINKARAAGLLSKG